MRRELEFKVELSSADVARLEGHTAPKALAAGPPKRQKLRSIYFDTPEHDLHAAGLSLRLRRQDGGWVQTVKADQEVAGLSNPVEVETPLATDKPQIDKIADKKLRRAVAKAAKDTELYPVFETVMQRTTRKIRTQGSQIELGVDEGEVRAGDANRDPRDAELELKAGSAAALLFAAEKLLIGQELKLSRRSKAERGYRLALGKHGANAEPEKARPTSVRRNDTSAAALNAILESATRQVLVNRQAVLETDDPEAAHQLRIGLRRLRSALRTLRPVADGLSLRAFERCARDLGRCVGELRDCDVLTANIVAPVEASADDKSGFAELRKAVHRYRNARREDVRAALRGSAWTKLQLYLTLWPRTLEENARLEKPVTKLARKVLRKAWKKPSKLGRNLDALDAEHRHELRKALKELRYACEFFEPLFAKQRARRFVKELEGLQDVFGYINDAHMAPKLIEIQKREQGGGDAAVAAGMVVGAHRAETRHVWEGAGKAWDRLNRLPRFWD